MLSICEPTDANAKIDPDCIRIRCRAGAAIAERLRHRRKPGGDLVALDTFHRFAHQVGEGRQRHKLPLRE